MVSFEDYIRGLLNFDVSDIALNSIRIKRGIAEAADVSTLSIRTLELAEADALRWYVTSPSTYTGVKDSDGGWSHQEASSSLTDADKRLFSARAAAIYGKWGESNGFGSRIKIVNLY